MKKIFTFLMVCLVGILGVFGLTGCGGNKENYNEYKDVSKESIYAETRVMNFYFYTCKEEEMTKEETKNKAKVGFAFDTGENRQMKAIEFNGEIVELVKKDKDCSKITKDATYFETEKEFPTSFDFFEQAKLTKIFYINENGEKVFTSYEFKPYNNGWIDIDTWLSFYK